MMLEGGVEAEVQVAFEVKKTEHGPLGDCFHQTYARLTLMTFIEGSRAFTPHQAPHLLWRKPFWP